MRTGSQSVEEQLVVAATTEVGKSTNTNTKTRIERKRQRDRGWYTRGDISRTVESSQQTTASKLRKKKEEKIKFKQRDQETIINIIIQMNVIPLILTLPSFPPRLAHRLSLSLSTAPDAFHQAMRQRRTPAEEAEALRISNAIDDELQVRVFLSQLPPYPDSISSASASL